MVHQPDIRQQPLKRYAQLTKEQMSLLGYCLYCKDLFIKSLSSAVEVEDFCCDGHEEAFNWAIEVD